MKGYKWIEDKAQWDSAEVTIQMLIYQLDSAKTSDQVIISKNDTYQYLGDNTYLINQIILFTSFTINNIHNFSQTREFFP